MIMIQADAFIILMLFMRAVKAIFLRRILKLLSAL